MITGGNASGVSEGFRPLELEKKTIKLLWPKLDIYVSEREAIEQRSC